MLEHVVLIEGAVAALSSAELGEQLRGEAQRSAHMLAGSVGTFGFARASEAAPARVPTMSTLVAIVRRELEGAIAPRDSQPAVPDTDQPEELRQRVFNAGADDYIAKPVVGPELVTRVSNRLERVRLYRAQAETDGLTGLTNRVTSEEGLKQLAALSDRFSEPLSVVMLDVDRFKLVNDTHGHAAGDSVLRRVGEYLRREFRGNDVVGRWGGEELIVGMYGMTRANAVRRLTDMHERFAQEQFPGSEDTFQVTFSAGVAEYPLDGGDSDAVCKAADEALYRAKAAGRARVLAAS